VREVRQLPSRVPGAVASLLTRLGVPSLVVEAEVRAMLPVCVGLTRSRSVVGSLVELGREAAFRLAPGGPPTFRWWPNGTATSLSLSDEAFEQVAALLELCKAGQLAPPVKPIETEADCTERHRAELFGSASEHYLLVRHLGPFTLADGHERVREGGRVRLKLKTVEGAQVVYRLQTPEEASRPVTLPDSSTAA